MTNNELQTVAERVFENVKDNLIEEMAVALKDVDISRGEVIQELRSKADTKTNVHFAVEYGGLAFEGMSEDEMVELLTAKDLQDYLHINHLNDIPEDWEEVNDIVEELDGFVNKFNKYT